jgi:hypothetical protein
MTQPFTGTPLLPQTQAPGHDPTQPTTVDTAATGTFTVYFKGFHQGSTQHVV